MNSGNTHKIAAWLTLYTYNILYCTLFCRAYKKYQLCQIYINCYLKNKPKYLFISPFFKHAFNANVSMIFTNRLQNHQIYYQYFIMQSCRMSLERAWLIDTKYFFLYIIIFEGFPECWIESFEWSSKHFYLVLWVVTERGSTSGLT